MGQHRKVVTDIAVVDQAVRLVEHCIDFSSTILHSFISLAVEVMGQMAMVRKSVPPETNIKMSSQAPMLARAAVAL